MRIHYLFLFLLCSFLVMLQPSTTYAATTMTVWTQSVAYKVQPTTAPGSANSITLEGARGSYEAYQIIVHANGGALSGVNLTASNLSDGLGHILPATNITFFREYFIDFTGITVTEKGSLPVPANSPTGDGRIPDPLIPFVDPYSGLPAGAPFTVAANLNQPVWMDVFIPANAVPGTYSGNVTVTAAGQPSITLPLTLTIWNLLLPDMRAVTTYFQMSTNDFIDYHSGTYACSGSNCWLDWNSAQARTVVKRYEELAHAHRIDIGENFIPDPSNGCSPPSNWSAYDAALAPYMNGTYWSDGVPSSRMDPPFSPGVTWGIEQNCTQAQ